LYCILLGHVVHGNDAFCAVFPQVTLLFYEYHIQSS